MEDQPVNPWYAVVGRGGEYNGSKKWGGRDASRRIQYQGWSANILSTLKKPDFYISLNLQINILDIFIGFCVNIKSSYFELKI